MELQGLKVNFLGDSITQGVGTSGDAYRFTTLLEQKYGMICRNYGISGTRCARQYAPSQNASFDQDFCSRVPLMDADADAVIVFGGTNDFGHGDAPFGSMGDRTKDTFRGALHVLYTSLIARYPNARILIATPLHRTNEDNPRGDGNKPAKVGTLLDYVNAIRETAQYYALPLIDLYASSGLQPRVPEICRRFVPDGLHPNDAGHVLLAERFASALRNC